jgi:predicted transglutaminase-like cysteine proteinase
MTAGLAGLGGFTGQAEAASAPPAFQGFCARYPADCRPQNAKAELLPLTDARLSELRAVNAQVNGSVREATDAQIYGRIDVWTLPTRGVGDCEDFALLKRHKLIERGWPSSALLITVVRDQRGEGHAVLSAVFDKGTYILDNRSRAVLPRSSTPYTYYTRQSASDPRAWVAIGPSRPVYATARTKRRIAWAD